MNKYLEKIASEFEIKLTKGSVPQKFIEEADKDPFLTGFTRPGPNRVPLRIVHNGKFVGFMTPKEDHGFWRTGSMYIKPEYRNRGIGTEAIKQFFSDKPKALSLVEPHNIASRRTYEKAGLSISERINIDGYDYDMMKRENVK